MRATLAVLLATLAVACTSGRPPDSRSDSMPATPDTSSTPGAAAAPATSPLEGTEWRLAEVGGRPVAAVEDTTRRAGLRLVADRHKVQGSTGCNRMMGPYKLDGATLNFGPLATTRMACPSMDTERAYLAALGATTRYEIDGGTLTLFGPDGPLARLEAAPGPN